MVWCRRNKGAHLTNASLSSVGGLGPPKPPLTRHLVSSSERAEGSATRHARGRMRGRQPGGRAWRESVLSIHDPWCYTLSCNTCNLSRHPLSRAVCGAVWAGAGAGAVGGRGGGAARIHSQVMNWNQPPRCHVYCLGSSMVRHCSRAGATSTGGQHSATREAYLGSSHWRRGRRSSRPLSRRLRYRRVRVKALWVCSEQMSQSACHRQTRTLPFAARVILRYQCDINI